MMSRTYHGKRIALLASVLMGAGTASVNGAEDGAEDFAPFPPGKNAALVKKVCAACHDASFVIDRRYDEAAAKKFYRLFVGDADSEQGRLVIEYLTTVLGE